MKLITSLFLVLLAFTGVAQTTSWESEDGKLSLDYPSDWDVNEHYPDTYLMIKSGYEDDNDLFREFVSINISVTDVKESKTYAHKVLMNGSAGPMGGDIVEQTYYGSAKTIYTIKEHTKQAMFDIYTRYYVFISDGKAYVFTYNANGDGYERMLEKANIIVKSFAVK